MDNCCSPNDASEELRSWLNKYTTLEGSDVSFVLQECADSRADLRVIKRSYEDGTPGDIFDIKRLRRSIIRGLKSESNNNGLQAGHASDA